MNRRPARVQMVGLLPTVLKPCGPACAQPFMNRNVRALAEEALSETPAFVRDNAERAHNLAERLFTEFGHDVEIEVVGLDSPKGFWIGLRHRIGKGFAVVVDGRDVFRGVPPYGELVAAVQRAIRR